MNSPVPSYRGYRFPSEIIAHAVWLYFRFSLSFRDEVSHQPTRQRERQMRRFKSPAHLQRFASTPGVVQNLFRVGRHLLRAVHHRVLRTRAFAEWDTVTCAC